MLGKSLQVFIREDRVLAFFLLVFFHEASSPWHLLALVDRILELSHLGFKRFFILP